MHGEGHRRKPVPGDLLGNLELRGPRNITSSNIDRIFDDGGRRFLVIEEKNEGEDAPEGQRKLLRALSQLPNVTVWVVRGTPWELSVKELVNGSLRWIAKGDWEDYQSAVHEWFGVRPPT
jgi:hypothetical protein